MRKIPAFIFVVMLIISSCDQGSDFTDSKVQVKNGRLAFRTMVEFDQYFVQVENDQALTKEHRLLNLQYTPYFSTLSKSQIENETNEISILGLKGLMILLNENREVQIGNEVYRIYEDVYEVYDELGNFLRKDKNEILVYDREGKSYKSKDKNINGRPFNEWRIFPISQSYEVRARFYQTSFIGMRFFYHNSELVLKQLVVQPKAQYFRFDHSVCLCQYAPSSLPPEYTYNVSAVTYLLGKSTYTYDNTYGHGFSLEWALKTYGDPQEFILQDASPG